MVKYGTFISAYK